MELNVKSFPTKTQFNFPQIVETRPGSFSSNYSFTTFSRRVHNASFFLLRLEYNLSNPKNNLLNNFMHFWNVPHKGVGCILNVWALQITMHNYIRHFWFQDATRR